MAGLRLVESIIVDGRRARSVACAGHCNIDMATAFADYKFVRCELKERAGRGSRRFQRTKQPVFFFSRARSEVESAGVASVSAVAKLQRPELLDRNVRAG